jgi:hypothetical protein
MKIYRVLEIITSTKIVLNCGNEQDIKLGDKFEIFGLTKSLIDPETQEDLGRAEIIRGKGKVVHLQEKLCTIESYLTEGGLGSRKIIKKTSAIGSIWMGGPSTEEEITGEPSLKNFEDIQIGDYARKLDK